jgi:hypothetical protein
MDNIAQGVAAGMTEAGSENKIVVYLLITALMVITFICAVAISNNYFSVVAWIVLITMNLAVLIYLLRR